MGETAGGLDRLMDDDMGDVWPSFKTIQGRKQQAAQDWIRGRARHQLLDEEITPAIAAQAAINEVVNLAALGLRNSSYFVALQAAAVDDDGYLPGREQ